MYSRDLIDDILAKADIVSIIDSYVHVTQKGRNFVALCPFHDDSNPSMQISREKRIFKCFACGAGGTAITFVRDYEKISYDAAVRKVADLIGYHDPRLETEMTRVKVDPSKEPLYACIKDLADYYAYSLGSEEGREAREYLAQRGIDEDSIHRFGIGYAPKDGATTVKYLQAKGHNQRAITSIGVTRGAGNTDVNSGRIVFPLYDPDGRVVGFSARRLAKDDTAKYINSPETPIFEKGKNLYNYHRAFQTARRDGYCYLLEGFMDVIALRRAGINSAVALMGTGLSSDQVALLRKLGCEIRLCLDGDLPGQEGMIKAVASLEKASISCRVVDYGDDERDPDDVFHEEGAEAVKAKMNNLVTPFQFQLSFFTSKKPATTAEAKKELLRKFVPSIAALESGVEKTDLIEKLAKATGYESETIRDTVQRFADRQKAKASGGVEYGGGPVPKKKERKAQTRLERAERQALHYMLKNREAIAVYLENIDCFYDTVRAEVANYLIDYDSKRKTDVELAKLLSDIDLGTREDKDLLKDEIDLAYNEDSFPPYSRKEMEGLAEVIREERQVMSSKRKTEQSLRGKDPAEASKILLEKARRKAAENGFDGKGNKDNK